MPLIIRSDPGVFHPDDSGAIRIGNTRVTLDSLVAVFNNGETPEQILQDFPTLDLADIYMALGYYLRHRAEVDEYIREGEAKFEQFEREHPEMCGVELRKKILERHRARMANDPTYFAYRKPAPSQEP